MIKVVDISHHQGKVDFEKMKAQGVVAVFIKCTQGTGRIDPRYAEYKASCRKIGLALGFYHFVGNMQNDGKTTVTADPIKEAEHFLKNVGDILPGEITILDWEPTVCDIDHALWVEKFLEHVKSKLGFRPIFYTYEARILKTSFKRVYEKDYGLWIADYGVNDGLPHAKPIILPWKFYVLWQYTSRGPGKTYGVSSTFIDLNQGDITLETLKKYGKPSNNPMPEPTPTPVKEQFHRYGHMDKVFVKLGDKVKKGQEIGTIGDGNGNYPGAAHVHYDCPNYIPVNWWDFPIGATREFVRDHYTTPYLFIEKQNALPTIFDHLGWDYLQKATYPNGTCFHPGCDINGKGGGNSDFGQVIKATRSGEVVYCYAEAGKNHGWGKLLVIKEGQVADTTPPENPNETAMYQDFFKKICKILNFEEFGDNMNENEAKEILDKIKKISDESESNKRLAVDLTNENAILRERIVAIQESTVQVEQPAVVQPTELEVVAVIPPAPSNPKLTLSQLFRKLFRLN
jgi:GH25 family lysozyme M1 (1,4-beta-N-acetylmuramidase)